MDCWRKKKKVVRSIGIAGSIRGSGATHLSVALANYAASGLNEKTAYLELDGHGEMMHWKAAGEELLRCDRRWDINYRNAYPSKSQAHSSGRISLYGFCHRPFCRKCKQKKIADSKEMEEIVFTKSSCISIEPFTYGERAISMGQLWERRMVSEGKMKLYAELQEIERQGVTLWLEGSQSDSGRIADAVCVNEDNAYMRDYICNEGVVKELRFDKVRNL